MEKDLLLLKAEASAAIQTQIVGIRAGASADASAAASRNLVAQRKDLEEWRSPLSTALRGTRKASSNSAHVCRRDVSEPGV
ncbi:hypothetical protein CCAX7_62730 [Capsulimonas corticalis]|uniref:Uncharacterized protein n=1 Tax=Capsulimonas corticalis TaxID=2219043 RepID=A0A402CWQ0_9BACT|nr:hypothetical protein CCAX7_62730 [Capsulimonas corticalis]